MSTKPRIVLAGGSGFLGQALARHFDNLQWEVVVLSRSARAGKNSVRYVAWDGRTPDAWQQELEGAQAVVNLAGKSVDCRYTPANRREILASRVDSTRVLGQTIGRCSRPPQVWLNSSTATVYKHTFGPPWDEHGALDATAEAKDAFSVEVAQAWERALNEAETPGTRKVALRLAMVLGHGKNSVFPVLRRLVRFGLGGPMAGGRQFVSWIHEVDYCRAVEWIIAHPEISGPVNMVAPNPLPNRDMMRILREVCHVPLGLPAYRWMLEAGAFVLRTETELIIKSRRVVPRRLLDSGFEFKFPEIRGAFADLVANDGTA